MLGIPGIHIKATLLVSAFSFPLPLTSPDRLRQRIGPSARSFFLLLLIRIMIWLPFYAECPSCAPSTFSQTWGPAQVNNVFCSPPENGKSLSVFPIFETKVAHDFQIMLVLFQMQCWLLMQTLMNNDSTLREYTVHPVIFRRHRSLQERL